MANKLDVLFNFFSTMDTAVFVKDEDLVFLFANRAFADILGIEPDEIVGKTAHDVVVRDLADKFTAEEREILETGVPSKYEELLCDGEGRPVWRLTKRERLVLDDGSLFLAASLTDITELKAREKELALANEKAEAAVEEASKAKTQLEEAIESLEDGFIFFDTQDHLVATNEAYRKQMGPAGSTITAGEKFEDLAMRLAKSGVVPNIEGNEENFVHDLMEKRQSELGVDRIYKAHNGKWIRQRDIRTPSGSIVGVRTDITKIKQKEVLLDAALDSSENGILLTSGDDQIVETNNKLLSMFGISADEIEQLRTYDELLDLLECKRTFAACEGDLEGEGDGRQITPDVIEKAKQEAVLLRLANGRIYRYRIRQSEEDVLVHSYVNITEEKRRESELANTIHALDVAQSGFLIHGYEDIVYADAGLANQLEVPGELVAVGQPISRMLEFCAARGDFGPDADADRMLAASRELAARNESYETERKLPSGRFISASITQKDDVSIVTYTDVTELKNRESELEAARLLLDEVISGMAQGVLVHDGDTILLSNRQWADIYGIPYDEILPGNSWADVIRRRVAKIEGIGPEDINARIAQIADRNRVGVNVRRLVDGRWIRIDLRWREQGGKIATMTDITQEKKREVQLEEAQRKAQSADRAKSEFLANMSHEIRTPMNGVMGMAELLAKTDLDAKQKMFTEVIVKSGASLLTIINDILDFSKIDADQMELNPAPFVIAEAVEDVATLVSSNVADKNLELIVRIDPDLPHMMEGDVGRIRQIITNMLGNAIKFTDEGHVYVDAKPVGSMIQDGDGRRQRLRVAVEDTGIGIPRDDLEKVFEKFSQADTSATRKHEGTGLGLSIASSLVKLMGGTIGVESEPGQGSTFWFEIELPVYKRKQVKRVPFDVSNARVLIVDDNEVNRSILTEQMASWRFDSAATDSGTEALAVMRAAAERGVCIDCVVLDYHMPEMDGADVVKAMRADPALGDIPVVMLTSVDELEDGRAFTSLGVQGHLTKPARSSLLLDTIVGVLQDDRARRAAVADDHDMADKKPQPSAMPDGDAHADQSLTSITEVAMTQSSGSKDQADGAAEQIDVLVCEDNEVNQIVFTQILQESGVAFRIANDGREGVSLYERLSPKVIIMDVSMPQMNGLEATTAIRKIEAEAGGHTPIIGVTAHALNGDMEKCMDAGMDDYLSKPISPNALIEKVGKWLGTELSRNVG